MLNKLQEIITSAYRPHEYPALGDQTARWKTHRPLAGVSVLDATPVFRNTVAKYVALLAAGADLTVGISDVMPRDKEIVSQLREAGIPVVKAEEDSGTFDVILDCAASFASWTARRGYAELTRSGVEAYARSGKPVYVADSGRIKRIETSIGTGESYFRAMARLGYTDWHGRQLVVFGSGKVGTGIVMHAYRLGARVAVVTDPATAGETVRRCAARIVDYQNTPAVCKAVCEAYAVVTATGVPHAVENCCPAEIVTQCSALLSNMGVEDEFGPGIPPERVLQGKNTLNFILEEPTHLKYIDATMALHNEGAVYLTEKERPAGTVAPPAETEEQLLEATRRNGCIAEELALLS